MASRARSDVSTAVALTCTRRRYTDPGRGGAGRSPKARCRCGKVSALPVQMWQPCAQSRNRGGKERVSLVPA